MKKTDIARLKRAVNYYDQVIRNLNAAYDSIDMAPTEYIRLHSGIDVTTLNIVSQVLKGAISERNWLKAKIQLFEELNDTRR